MVAAGAFAALQPLINANLSTRVGVIESSFVSFLVGTIALGGVIVALRHGDLRGVSGAPWWHLTGGLLGAFFVTVTIVAVPRIGTAAAIAAAIAAQLAAGLLFDHLGVLGGRQIPIDAMRVSGTILLFAGAALILKG
jgi:transporter family-2 protein